MVTVHDIAKRAGVAVGTVSRVLHHHPAVQHAIRQRVWQAIEEMGYQPLRRLGGRWVVRHVAIVTLGMDRALAALPVVGDLLHGVHDALRAQEMTLSFIEIPDPTHLPLALTTGAVDAVIVKAVMRSGDFPWPSALRATLSTLPHVWLTDRPSGFTGDVCGTDDYAVGQLASTHLLARGHHILAILNPDPSHLLFARRSAAFTHTAQQMGATVHSLTGQASSQAFPYRPAANLVEVLPLVDRVLALRPRPTALFVPADSIAAQVYRALAIRQVAVGEEISVISVNYEPPILAGLYPRLTTIDIHSAEVGRRAVELLLWRIEHPDAGESNLQLTPSLVSGDSVAHLSSRP